VAEALYHAGFANDSDVEIKWINAEQVTPQNVGELLSDVDGILVPGGFGDRGIEGKISATRYARENRVPFLGICLGMQVAVIEYARHVAGLDGANSSEINPDTKYPVIDLLPEQKEVEDKGGTMRLG
ncbi:CTP synthase, partial [Frankia sp. Mgl5]|nr:CTP synthase [Frankia sp. Mgl5]